MLHDGRKRNDKTDVHNEYQKVDDHYDDESVKNDTEKNFHTKILSQLKNKAMLLMRVSLFHKVD